jgi:hypothetical protein
MFIKPLDFNIAVRGLLNKQQTLPSSLFGLVALAANHHKWQQLLTLWKVVLSGLLDFYQLCIMHRKSPACCQKQNRLSTKILLY